MTQSRSFLRLFPRLTAGLLTLAMLAGCSSSASRDSSSTAGIPPETVQSVDPGPASSGELRLVSSAYGAITSSGVATETGYYSAETLQAGTVTVVYTDYASRSRTYLCADPNCAHNSDSCTALFSATGTAALFASADGQTLYLAATNMADSDCAGILYAFAPDGSNRCEVYRLSGQQAAIGSVAESDSALYLEVQVMDPDTYAVSWELLALDPDTGEASTLFTIDQPGDRLTSAFGNCLVFDSVSDTARSYYPVNASTGEKSEPLYSYDYTAQVRVEQAKDGFVYSLRPGEGDDRCDLFQVSLETGEEEKLAADIPIYDLDSTRFAGLFDGHAEIETSDTRDMENIQPLKYSVNLSTGEVRQSTLSYQRYENTTFVLILAETSSDFLVRSGEVSRPVTVVDESGIPTQVDSLVPSYSLIAKSDYWNNNPAYQEIEDLL